MRPPFQTPFALSLSKGLQRARPAFDRFSPRGLGATERGNNGLHHAIPAAASSMSISLMPMNGTTMPPNP